MLGPAPSQSPPGGRVVKAMLFRSTQSPLSAAPVEFTNTALLVVPGWQKPPEVVYRYRRMGLPWYDVGLRAGLPTQVWYIPVERDPGPPYGKAYGYRRNHEHDGRHAKLNDREVRDLVSVRMAHEYYGVSPEIARNWRRDGCDVRTMMTREYRSRHRDEGRHDHDGDDRGDGKHHGKHHGHDRD